MLFFVILMMICVAGYGYFSHIKRLIIEEKQIELTTIAKLKAGQIIQWRKERLGDAATIHKNSILADRIRDYLAGSAPPSTLDELKTWMESLRSSYGYHSAALYKTDGTMLVSTISDLSKPDILSGRLIGETVRKSDVFFSDFHRDEVNGEIHLNIVIPVGQTIRQQFKTVAVLILDIDPHQFLYPLIQAWPTISSSSETELVERRGDDVLFLNELRHQSDTAMKLRLPLTDRSIAAVQAALGQEGIFEGKDYRGLDVLSVSRKIPDSPWAIVAKVDMSEINEPITTRAWLVTIFCSLLLLGTGLGIYNRWSKQLAEVTLESEEKYRAVADNIYDWEYWKGVDGTIVYCSPSCERISGYTADEFRVDPELLIRIIHPDDRERFKHHLDFDANGLATTDCHGVDFRILTRSGVECWISHICQEIYDASGKSLGRRACNSDITERKRIEKENLAYQESLEQLVDARSAELRESEKKYQVLFMESPDAYLIIVDGIFVECNKASEIMLRGDRQQIVGQPPDILSPEFQHDGRASSESAREKIKAALRDGNNRFEWLHRRFDGSEFFVEVSIAVIPLEDKPALLVGWRDITARKLAEEALRESAEALKRQNSLFDSLLKNLSVGVFMVEAPSGKPLLANETAFKLLGRGILPDATRDNLSEVYKAIKTGTRLPYPPEELPIVLAMSGKTSHVEDMLIERPDGTKIYLEVYGSPITDERGNVWASLASFADITTRKMAEFIIHDNTLKLERRVKERTSSLEVANIELLAINRELDQRRLEAEQNQNKLQQLSSAVVNSPAAVVITDSSGIIEYVNPKFTEMSGYLSEEAVGRNPSILSAGVQTKEYYREMWATIGAGLEWRGEFCNKKKNGDIYWEHASISPIKDQQGKITHFVAIKEDITEDKRMAEELVAARDAADAANRSKSEFLANMSHEIRTPLNAIIGFSALVLKSSLPPHQHDYIGKIHSSGELLLNIINDILDFSKIEARQLKMEQIPFRLDIVIANVTSMVMQKALDSGLNLLVETSPEVPTCLVGDPHRLTQVIANLLNNAVKFTERGEVRLDTMLLTEANDRVHLKFSVSDTGIGLSAEQIDKLFQPFTQADGSTTRKFGGTGLGLSISKQLVKLMEGEIWCESIQGEGSCFCFTAWFGIAQASDREQCLSIGTAKPVYKGTSYNFSGSRILLVEDNEINRQLAIELLKESGAEVDIAVNGKEAVTMITAGGTQYDLVLMDVQMPVMDGYEATRLIRSESRFNSLPLIAMTAHAMQEEQEKILQAGMNAHISKPIDAQTMLRTIGSFLGGRDTSLDLREKPENDSEDETVIPDIEGLDIQVALDHLDGDRKLYLWVLRTFLETESNAAKLIEEALSAGDTNLALRLAHTIKGTAGSMSATELENLASILESAIGQDEPPSNIMTALEQFAAELERLVTELKSQLPLAPKA